VHQVNSEVRPVCLLYRKSTGFTGTKVQILTPELQGYNTPLIYLEISNTTFFGYSVYYFNGTKVQIRTLLPAVEQVNFICWYKYKRTNTDAATCSAPDDYQRFYRQLPVSYLRHTMEVNVGRSCIHVYVYIHIHICMIFLENIWK
jgi:hypothetical protein